MSSRLLVLPLVAATVFVAWPAAAQVPRNPVTASPQPAAPGVPSFRDPKTGQVWTPNNVGGYSGPETTSQDRAFNPSAQAVPAGQVYQQNAQVSVIGQVPITAGPTVPLVDIDDPSLTVQPGARWQVVMYLQNNSASTFAPSLNCRFTNAGTTVMASYVQIGPVAGGNRVGLVFSGPPSSVYVDNVSCNVLSP
jgi:hypothetical protein